MPLVGVNTYLFADGNTPAPAAVVRSSEAERQLQVDRTAEFRGAHQEQATAALDNLKRAILLGDNSFAALMEATRVCTLGQISQSLFEVGGHYRRNQ